MRAAVRADPFGLLRFEPFPAAHPVEDLHPPRFSGPAGPGRRCGGRSPQRRCSRRAASAAGFQEVMTPSRSLLSTASPVPPLPPRGVAPPPGSRRDLRLRPAAGDEGRPSGPRNRSGGRHQLGDWVLKERVWNSATASTSSGGANWDRDRQRRVTAPARPRPRCAPQDGRVLAEVRGPRRSRRPSHAFPGNPVPGEQSQVAAPPPKAARRQGPKRSTRGRNAAWGAALGHLPKGACLPAQELRHCDQELRRHLVERLPLDQAGP